MEEKARIIFRELGVLTLSPPPTLEVESNSTNELRCSYTYLMHPLPQHFVGIVHPAGHLWKRIPRKLKKKRKKLKIN